VLCACKGVPTSGCRWSRLESTGIEVIRSEGVDTICEVAQQWLCSYGDGLRWRGSEGCSPQLNGGRMS
jgi:hypothetical protein